MLVLLGRLGLKFRRQTPQPVRDREIEGGSGHRNQSFGLPTQYAPLTTDSNPLNEGFGPITQIEPHQFRIFSVPRSSRLAAAALLAILLDLVERLREALE